MKKNKSQKGIYDIQQAELLTSQDEETKYEPKGIRKAVDLSQQFKVFKIQNEDPKRGNKKIDMVVQGLGIPTEKYTPQGLPAVDESVLHTLAGSPKDGKYGTAFDFFQLKGQEEFGKKLCEALQTLLEYRGLQTLISTFILPLKEYPDENGRIHCSLNINTETGRLSARKPNMQNQPALEKDIFKIRKAFTAQKGNKLIVADYGQLQLRVLAHLTNCKAMINAFKQGGDFHSRTAISMYPYIKKEIQEGKVLLEWDKSKGEAPAPLLKDKYASERKKAKTVNFSIAYGKSAKGFADDWNCSLKEAKDIIKAWFADRPEVQEWQKHKQLIAQKKKITQTLLGRYRKLDKFFDSKVGGSSLIGMRQRRAINTPIQGGAADIVIAAMVKIHYNEQLRKMGWKLLMQIHDQLILEGPQESAEKALQIVKYNMSHPFDQDLRIQLEIDAKIGDNWYQCK